MRKLLVAIACALALGTIATPPASAHVLINHDWGQGDQVGTSCGLTYGGYVKAVQAMLWADHRYLNQSQGWVNGNFGGESSAWTDGAIRNFQSAYAPPSDGCVGFNTWRVMQSMTTFQYSSGWQDIFRFHTYYSEYISFYEDYCTNAWMVSWFDGNYLLDHGMSSSWPTCT